MIGKLRKKLVLAAMASLLAVLLVIMGGRGPAVLPEDSH